jgi:hypothetical protein
MKQNLIYLLTNISKKEGRRFYIGSKQEASLENFDGIMTILNRDDKPYYSSTTSYEMLNDMRNGDVFEASVLEAGVDRSVLTEVENSHIKKYDAVYSSEYYNKAYAILDAHYDPSSLANKYGETIAQLSCRNSSWGKREGRAKECGFKNFGEMYFWIQEQKDKGMSGRQVSEAIGKERHFAYRTIKDMDIVLAKKQYELYKGDQDFLIKLKTMIYNNCSPIYACELLGVEFAAGRALLGDYGEKDKHFIASLKRGMTKDELEKKVVQFVYDSPKVGAGFKDAAKALNLSLETTRRYFIRYVKNNMDRPE